MKLWYDKKSKDPTYFIQMGIRNGKKTTTRNVSRIGKHSELLRVTEDPLAYAKEQVRKYSEEYSSENKVTLDLSINFSEKIKATQDTASKSTRLNIGYFFIQKLYNELGISDFFREATKDSRIRFDPDTVNRFLTYARILNSDSKLGTLDHLGSYYEKPDFDYQHIMRTMDIMEANYSGYIENLYQRSCGIVRRNTAVCYYDCSNYYFEIEREDEDYTDEVTGEVIRGLRKFGLAKDHKPNPIVEMGLFMDRDGIPISMCITSGSDNEQTTAIPLEEEMVKMFKGKKFIYCADAGLGSFNIRKFNSMGGRAFIVTQSVKKLSDVMKQAVFNDYGYRLLSSDEPVSLEHMKSFDRFDADCRGLYDDRAYKVIPADRAIDLGLYEEKATRSGKPRKVKSKATLKQYVIVSFSRKMMEYQRSVRNRQIERARGILDRMDPESYRKGPHDVTRFIVKRTSGEDKVAYEINEDKIREEEKYDGFYAIATNLEDSAKDIIEVSMNRYKIEDCFRIMKTDFMARPVWHYKREHIISHFMICYTALLIYRLMEKKLEDNGTHFTTDAILETLKNMEVASIEDICYMSLYTGSQLCTALNAVFGLGLDKKYYQPKELNKKIKKILK